MIITVRKMRLDWAFTLIDHRIPYSITRKGPASKELKAQENSVHLSLNGAIFMLNDLILEVSVLAAF